MSGGDALVRGLVGDGRGRLLWADLSEVGAELARRHTLDVDGALLAAELSVATALMSAWIKGEERLMVQFQGTAPESSYVGEITASGAFRGRFRPQVVERPAALDGILLTLKSEGSRELYRGVTPVAAPRLEAALQEHLSQSDQVQVQVRIEAAARPDGTFVARGFVLERFPAEDGRPSWLRAAFDALAAELAQGDLQAQADEVARGRFAGAPLEVLDHRPVAFDCWCSRAKVEAMLFSLGTDELTAILEEDGRAEVNCHFCNVDYRFDRDTLTGLRDLSAARR